MMVQDVRTTPAGGAARTPEIVEAGGQARLHLTLAVADYDHVRDLVFGVVRPDGIALTAFTLQIEEIFYRFTKNEEWDVSEMSFAKYIALTAQGNVPMIGLPVFPSRVFRHSAIYVRSDRGIRTAKDLEGKTVGIPEWAQTAGIYQRGILAENYGVDLSAIRWAQAGVNEPGRVEKVELKLPAGIRYENRPDKSISGMLAAGEIDAAMSARTPDCFLAGHKDVVRLYPEYRAEEARFFAKSGVFPIMHLIAVRRAAFERHPWIVMNLTKAFEEAKRRSVERVRDLTASRVPLPWCPTLAEEFDATFGPDPFPYGVEANRVTLDAFCRYAHDQGITARKLAPEDLFPAEVRGSYRV
jgi:4,5-dihydroxyphthalate decarboxylase